MKIFGVGFIKTGTTSLATALTRLGYNHCHGGYLIANKMVGPYLNSDMAAFKTLISKYDSFEDFPFCAPGMAQKLDVLYPDCKFILTTRKPESWFRSVSTYFNPVRLGPPVSLLEMSRRNDNRPFGRFPGMVCCMLATFGTLEVEANKEHYLAMYRKYNQDIIDYFKNRPDKLLVVSWMEGHGWPELCNFLGKTIPTSAFPVSNPNSDNHAK